MERTIKESVLVGSTSTALNDPFELCPVLIDDLSKESIKESLKFYSKGGSACQMDPEFDLEDLESWREKCRRTYRGTVRRARILSFSDNLDSPLLWSHYAAAHKGACLHFTGRAFNEMRYRKGVVSYKRQRPTLPFSLLLRALTYRKEECLDEEFQRVQSELNDSMFFTKPSDWSYEGEYRVIYNGDTETGAEFNQAGLIEVILGSRMSDENEERLRALLADSAFEKIAVRKAKISHRTFSVDLES
ncbi:hypothetical protein GGR90_003331 [Sphingopyxis italica]|uniref:DUF2971 domain-containing protein n=1 Tax=Sphingopyxis italica TaxID=1129133 RepID=A0A7X6BA91_9SPHN|nr:hypothetical protein [Sphingopyxis italica]